MRRSRSGRAVGIASKVARIRLSAATPVRVGTGSNLTDMRYLLPGVLFCVVAFVLGAVLAAASGLTLPLALAVSALVCAAVASGLHLNVH